jgi:predicted aldo/keto reductase-like oxidoreductase
MIGEVLKGRPRDSFAISTKARLPGDRKTGAISPESTEDDFTKKINASLQNLGLEYIDIYHHHGIQGREGALHEPTLKALEKAKKAGKIRFIGITTHQNEPEVIRAAIESKIYDVVLPAYNPRQQHVQEVKKAIAEAAGAGLGVISMKAIGGRAWGTYPTKSMEIRADLKWPLQDPNVHTVIAGFTTFEQMNQDLEVMKDITLSQSEKEYLRRAAQAPGLYCQGCGKCLSQCAKQLPIPDLMRAYMYVYGYRNLVEAQDLLFSLNLPADLCGDCSSCPVKCSNDWKVSTRIRDVARLREVPTDFVA